MASHWVKDEASWAYLQTAGDPERILLPVLAGPVAENDIPLFLRTFKRVEAPGVHPYPIKEALRRTFRTLGLTPEGEAPTSQIPQATESVDDLLTPQ